MLNLDRITTLLLAAVNIHLPTCKYLSRIPLPHETHTILSPSHLISTRNSTLDSNPKEHHQHGYLQPQLLIQRFLRQGSRPPNLRAVTINLARGHRHPTQRYSYPRTSSRFPRATLDHKAWPSRGPSAPYREQVDDQQRQRPAHLRSVVVHLLLRARERLHRFQRGQDSRVPAGAGREERQKHLDPHLDLDSDQ
jgi:hypothetical protein